MKIRIGKELHISWSILTQGENKPLEGRDLHLYLQDHNRRRRSLEFTTDANTLLVVIPANTLTSIGRYALILTENEGQEGQTAVDANPAFTLVETSREEDTNTTDAPNLEVATINLATGNLTLRMVLQELFDGKEGGDMKTGDILPVLRNGELHRVSAQIGADCSAEIEALTAKVEENTANIASATSAASEALTAAKDAQATATTAIENAEYAQVIANEAKTNAEGIEGKADDALNKATEATGKADAAENAAIAAQNAAQEAQTAATTASDNAAQAKELATEAKTVAEQAQGAATNALSEAIEAKSNAATAFSAANSAQSTADAAQAKNTEQDTRMDKFESRLDPDIAGRVWNEDNATSKAESYYGSLKSLRDLPKRLGLGRYLVTDDRQKFKLHPNDSNKYLDGSPAKLDGSEGQCMWCWNGFYANIWHEGSRLIKAVTFDKPVGGETSIWIPAGGISWLGAGVMDRTENKLCSIISDPALYGPEFDAERYRGGAGVAVDPSKCSKAPAADSPQITMLGMPATRMSTTLFGEAARRRGDGWEANWFVARFVVEFLFEIIMGTENSQEAFNNLKDANGLYQGGFGTGVTDMSGWDVYNGECPVIPTSVGLEAGDGVCLVSYKLPQTDGAEGDTYKEFKVPVFFGLVHAGFGHLLQLVRGLIMDAGEEKSPVYVTPSMYAEYDHKTVADKIMVAECPRVSGYIKRKSYQGLCCMPTEVGGSATIRFADYFLTSVGAPNDLRVRAAGGDSRNELYAGASYMHAGNSGLYANISYSSPLCYFEEDPIIPESEKIRTIK